MFFLLIFSISSDIDQIDIHFTNPYVITEGGSYNFENCLFETVNQVAISISSGSSKIVLNCDSCTFRDIKTDGDGAAFLSYRILVEVNFHFVCIFNCQAKNRGGAFYYDAYGVSETVHPTFEYMTIGLTECNERITYIVGNSNSNLKINNCNLTNCETYNSEASNGAFLLCDYNSYVNFCSFVGNTNQNCLISYEQSHEASITGITETCNIIQNSYQGGKSLLLVTRQTYNIRNSIIIQNEGEQSIFGSFENGLFNIYDCVIQSTSISGFLTEDCIFIPQSSYYTTHPIAFYRTLQCFADITYYPDQTPFNTPVPTPFRTPSQTQNSDAPSPTPKEPTYISRTGTARNQLLRQQIDRKFQKL